MRKATELQGRLDCQSVASVCLNLECRDANGENIVIAA